MPTVTRATLAGMGMHPVPGGASRPAYCPVCAVAAPPAQDECPGCGLRLASAEAGELHRIAAELARLQREYEALADRRAALLARQVRWQPPQTAAATGPAPAVCRPTAAEPAQVPGGSARRELSHRAVSRFLLAVGGALVVIAAAVFTVMSWGGVGASGRAAITLSACCAVLALPPHLVRRGLRATGEVVAIAGLAMTVAAAFLVGHLLGWSARPDLTLASAGCAALAAGWAGYGVFARVRGPRAAAIGLFQAVLPLAVAAVWPSLPGLALALVLTCAADLSLAWTATWHQARLERLTGTVAAAATWIAGVALAWAGLAGAPAGAARLGCAAVVVLTGVLAALGAPLIAARVPARAGLAAAGVLLVTGTAAAVADGLPSRWAAAAYAGVAAVSVICSWRWGEVPAAAGRDAASGPAPGRGGLVRRRWQVMVAELGTGAAAVLAGTAAWVTPAAVAGLLWSLALPGGAWHRAGAGAVPGGASPATLAVLALVAWVCWRMPWVPRWRRALSAAIAALGAAAAPAVIGLQGWLGLSVLTAAAWALALGAAVFRDRLAARTAAGASLALAAIAIVRSLTGAAGTIAVLAALAAVLVAVALAARDVATRAVLTAGAVAVVAGLAWATPLAIGGADAMAAFAVLGVAALAAGTASLVRRSRPVDAMVLELSAGPVAVLAGVLAAGAAEDFSLVAVAAALLSSGAAWLREGRRRALALGGAVLAAGAALVPQAGLLGTAALLPYRGLALPWRGTAVAAAAGQGLPFALIVLTGCAAALVIGAGAVRGGRGSLDAVAAVLPVVAAPAGPGLGLGFAVTVAALLALAILLIVWAALSESLAPAGAALVAISLALGWALRAPGPTLTVLGGVCLAGSVCAWRGRHRWARRGAAVTAVLCAGAFAQALALARGLAAWQAGLTVLACAAVAQLLAARLARAVPLLSPAVEASGWALVLAGVVPAVSDPGPASLALAAAAGICLVTAVRPGRRPLLWAGLILAQAGLCVHLAAAGVSVPEPYTLPAAGIMLGYGWHGPRRVAGLNSWARYGPGLALALLPSLAAVLVDGGWIRPLLLGLACLGLMLAGARARLGAPLVTGAAVLVAEAGRELAPAARDLAGWVPGWVPIAAGGAGLIVAGATYEARLRDLRRLRRALAALG